LAAPLLDEVRFCLRCGTRLQLEPRFGGLRPVCSGCGWIYFADPKVAAAVLVEQAGRVLLARRVSEPHSGLWTLPAGFVDAGEDPALAAARECREETGLQVRVTRLLDVIYGQEHPRGAHIFILYQAEVLGGTLTAADDVDAVGFFAYDDLPPLAFQTTQRILYHQKYQNEKPHGTNTIP
jgi:ADP-ribose pyrophosphatase YjhB (NUDIX family)